jgi:hypothetical protein
MSRRSVEAWRRHVYQHHAIKDTTRVLLLWLADQMDAARTVCLPRKQMAEALGISTRRIDDRMKAAREAKLLTVVTRGQKGRTAKYQGTFSATPVCRADDEFSARATSALMRDPRMSPRNPVQRDPRMSRQYYSGTPISAHHSDVGNDEETEGHPVRSELLVCECHGAPDCASLEPQPARTEETA